MRLFLSYARVDKPYCHQIANTLDVHEIWYDQRLYAGQNWWAEILRRLDWCEGFVYLISPDSLRSEYCRREFDIARSLGRPIFPIVIRPNTPLPDSLVHLQYVDMSRGITSEATKTLLDSIYLAEKQSPPLRHAKELSEVETKQPAINPASVMRQIADAMENGQYDQAVFLLRQAKNSGFVSNFIDLDLMLSEAEQSLHRQSYMLEADREYKQIYELIQRNATRRLGFQALLAFRKQYPDYDPNGLYHQFAAELNQLSGLTRPPANHSPSYPNARFTSASMAANALGYDSEPPLGPADSQQDDLPSKRPWNETSNSPFRGRSSNGNGHGALTLKETVKVPLVQLPMLEWCEIPAGEVQIWENEADGHRVPRYMPVERFRMSKYPITNAQYQVFLDDPSGYANISWWAYSAYANHWRMNNSTPKNSKFGGAERPREMVNWYDALAFCHWLSFSSQLKITLPLSTQWQRAFQGDDGRMYPWGDDFDKDRCNTSESGLKFTTIVMRYDHGQSPFGVYDMAGNTWEWCLDTRAEQGQAGNEQSSEKRIVRGGSFMSPAVRSKADFLYDLDPASYHNSIGFRIVDATPFPIN